MQNNFALQTVCLFKFSELESGSSLEFNTLSFQTPILDHCTCVGPGSVRGSEKSTVNSWQGTQQLKMIKYQSSGAFVELWARTSFAGVWPLSTAVCVLLCGENFRDSNKFRGLHNKHTKQRTILGSFTQQQDVRPHSWEAHCFIEALVSHQASEGSTTKEPDPSHLVATNGQVRTSEFFNKQGSGVGSLLNPNLAGRKPGSMTQNRDFRHRSWVTSCPVSEKQHKLEYTCCGCFVSCSIFFLHFLLRQMHTLRCSMRPRSRGMLEPHSGLSPLSTEASQQTRGQRSSAPAAPCTTRVISPRTCALQSYTATDTFKFLSVSCTRFPRFLPLRSLVWSPPTTGMDTVGPLALTASDGVPK